MIRELGVDHCNEAFELWNLERSVNSFVGESWSLNSIKKMVSLGDSLGYFIEERLQAFILGRRGTVWEVELLVTSPTVRRQGVMRRLFEAWKEGLPPGMEVWVEVHVRNIAGCGFYESIGFVRVGKRNSYYKDGGDALLYSFFALDAE